GMTFEELAREVVRRGLLQPPPADPEAFIAEHVRRHLAGRRRFVEQRGRRWIAVEESRTGSGYTVVTPTDVSEIKGRERELRRSRRLLRAVIDAVPAIVNVKDLDSRYVLMNHFQGELYGVEPDAARGRTSEEFTGTIYGGGSRAMDEAVIRSGESLPWTERDFVDVH